MIARWALVVAYVVFVANLGELLTFGAINTANVIEKATFLVTALLLLALRPTSKPILALMVAAIVLVVVLGAFTVYPAFSWGTLLASLNQFIIIYVLLAFRPRRRDAEVFIATAAFLPIASVALGVVYSIVGIHPLTAVEYATGASRLQGSLIPAFLSGLAMCGTFASLQLVISLRHKAGALLLPLNFIILLLAGGRAALAATLASCAAALLIDNPLPARQRRLIVGAAIGGAAVIGLVFGGKLITRLLNSGDNGRDLMASYLTGLAAKYEPIGIGYGHQFWAVPRNISVIVGSSAAHDDFLRLQTELGFVGMPVFYALLGTAVLVAAFRGGRTGSVTVIATFLAFLLLSRTDNALSSPAYFPLIALAVMAKWLQIFKKNRRAALREVGCAPEAAWTQPDGLPVATV